jgi:importin subunit beta-1
LQAQANQILTAVCKGIKDANNEIKLAGCRAMLNALEFVRSNFEKDLERNYIMQVLCDAAVCPDPKVRTASMECLVKIGSLYYDKLAPYMKHIFNVSCVGLWCMANAITDSHLSLSVDTRCHKER